MLRRPVLRIRQKLAVHRCVALKYNQRQVVRVDGVVSYELGEGVVRSQREHRRGRPFWGQARVRGERRRAQKKDEKWIQGPEKRRRRGRRRKKKWNGENGMDGVRSK